MIKHKKYLQEREWEGEGDVKGEGEEKREGEEREERRGESCLLLTKMAPLFLSALMNSTEDLLDPKSLTFLLFKLT